MNLDHAPQRLPDVERATTQHPHAAPRTCISTVGMRWWSALLLVGLLLLPFVLPAPRHGLAVDIGAEVGLNDFGESREGFYLFDVNPPERDGQGATFRWSKGFSTLRFLQIFAVGSPLLLELRACGCRPVGTAPATGTLKLNSAPPLALPLDGQPRTYRFLVPYQPSDYGNDLYLELRGNTFRLPNDDRELGVRLDRASVAPLAQPWSLFGLPPLAAWALYALAVGLAWSIGVRSQTFSHGRWSMVDGRWSILLLALPYLYRPHIFPPLLLAALSCVAVGGALVVGRTVLHRVVLAAAGLWMAWSSQILGFWILDDAYISFRYAANMLVGQGLVFNPGERVEGYTNFLWTMLMALPLAAGLDPTLPSAALTLLVGLGVVWLVYLWGLGIGDGGRGTGGTEKKDSATGWNKRTPFSRVVNVSQSPIPNPQSPIALFAPLLLALSTPFLLYTARGSGMETGLFMLLLAGGSLAVQRATDRRGLFLAGALLGLATMTRPDGVLGLAAAGAFLVRQKAKGKRQNGASIVSSLLPLASHLLPLTTGFVILFLPYYLWRYLYYGYPLPNTFYAKVGSGWAQTQRGLDYAADFATTIGWRFVTLMLLLGFGAAFWRTWRDGAGTGDRGLAIGEQESSHRRSSTVHGPRSIVHLVTLIALYTAYIIYVGGDHFPGFRFFVPILPFLALLLQYALSAIGSVTSSKVSGANANKSLLAARHSSLVTRLLPCANANDSPLAARHSSLVTRLSPLIAIALALLYLAFTATQLPASNIGIAWSPVRGEYNVVEKNRELGLWLRDNAPPDTVVATGIAGALPFYSGLRVIDTLGLNDLHIAHLDVAAMGAGIAGAEKTDVPYVLDQRPDYIPYSTSGTFQGYPRFKAEYTLVEVRGPEGRAIKLYRRKE